MRVVCKGRRREGGMEEGREEDGKKEEAAAEEEGGAGRRREGTREGWMREEREQARQDIERRGGEKEARERESEKSEEEGRGGGGSMRHLRGSEFRWRGLSSRSLRAISTLSPRAPVGDSSSKGKPLRSSSAFLASEGVANLAKPVCIRQGTRGGGAPKRSSGGRGLGVDDGFKGNMGGGS